MKSTEHKSLSVANPDPEIDQVQKGALALGFLGLFIILLSLFNVDLPNKPIFLAVSILSIFAGIYLYAKRMYLNQPEGIKNNGVWLKSFTSRGNWAWVLGVVLTAFYVVLYWYPEYLGLGKGKPNTGVIALFDPLSYFLKNQAASEWFVYGVL
ncbi:MAG: FeS-binding protein, partial [Bacteroidetes bacterium HGW-Bacteroidetes-13]